MRVVVAEDTVLFREGLVRLLAEAGFDVVGQVSDADALLEAVRTYQPDVAIVDVRMPPSQTTEGLDAASTIQAHHPGTGVLVLSHHLHVHHATKLLEAGTGVGYLLKESVTDTEQLHLAVRTVGTGGTVIGPELVRKLTGRRRRPGPLDSLTKREREVLVLIAEGLTNPTICKQLGISDKTVEGHITRIFDKLALEEGEGLNRRVLAVLTYLRETA